MTDQVKLRAGHARERYALVYGDRRFVFDMNGRLKVAAKDDPLADDDPVFEFSWLFGLHPHAYDPHTLATLAAVMTRGPTGDGWLDDPGTTPAGYTYLGQFIAHELTWLNEPQGGGIKSHRSPQIDLDSLFNAPPTQVGNLCPGAAPLGIGCTQPASVFGSFPHDLPRKASGEALIADIRNDDVFPLAQIHQLLLRFYNKASAFLGTQDPAVLEKAVLQHFQSVVLHDYLATMIDTNVYNAVMSGRSTFIPSGPAFGDPIRLPIEFAGAAFRFGHSMVRNEYPAWNRVNPAAGPETFWKFTFNSRDPATMPMLSLPSDWVTNWLALFDVSGTGYPEHCDIHLANKIDTRIAFQLGAIPPHALRTDNTNGDLPHRTLQRAVTLQIADGQTVVAAFNSELPAAEQIVPLTMNELRANECPQAITALEANNAELLHSTPLWFYVLKEAEVRAQGNRLGPVGSRLVMETIHGVLEFSKHSILQESGWVPALPSRDGVRFQMADLLAFTGELNPIGGCGPVPM